MGKSNKDKQNKFNIDLPQIVIGFFLGIVSYNLTEGPHHRAIEEQGKATIASKIIPYIDDSNQDISQRTNYLAILNSADAIKPRMAAQYGQKLIDNGVSDTDFFESIKPSMLQNVEPFIEEAGQHFWEIQQQLTDVTNHKQCSATYRAYTGSFDTSHRILSGHLEEIEQDSNFSRWKSAFSSYLDSEISTHARNKFGSNEFLVRQPRIVNEKSRGCNYSPYS